MAEGAYNECVYLQDALLRHAHCFAVCPYHVRSPQDIRSTALFNTRTPASFWKFRNIIQILYNVIYVQHQCGHVAPQRNKGSSQMDLQRDVFGSQVQCAATIL
jgi:hypothetical protein